MRSTINLLHACILHTDVLPEKKTHRKSLKSKNDDERHTVRSGTATCFTLEHKQQKEIREKPANLKIFSEDFVMNHAFMPKTSETQAPNTITRRRFTAPEKQVFVFQALQPQMRNC